MTILHDNDLDLARARDLVVIEWREAGYLDLLDLTAAHRDHLMTTTKAGWDRHLTIRQSSWTYADLDVDAQARVDCVLRNRAAREVSGRDYI